MTDGESLIRRLKQRYRRHRLHRLGVFEKRRCTKTLVGTGSGAWTVCLDGLDETSVVYSFGAGTDISFDLDLHHRTGARIHIFDPTPRSIEWINRQKLPNGVQFHDFGIGAKDGTITFYPPRRSASSHFSPVVRYRKIGIGETITAPVYRLSTIVRQLQHDRISLLKMDIEGGEYDVIDDLADQGVAPEKLLVEFHHAYATIPLARTVESVGKLEDLGFQCFHISERTYEMSFLAAQGRTRN
jgi:FkbM family methyltransferase